MWYVYVLKSRRDGKRYIGSTNDLERRFREHNDGFVTSTKHRKPFDLVYTETCEQEWQARLREKYFKTHKGYNELRKILNIRSVV